MRLFIWLSLLAAGIAPAMGQCPDAQRKCWVVVNVIGKWEITTTHRQLMLGDGLNPGTEYGRAPLGERRGAIKLVWDEANTSTHDCADGAGCARPFLVPDAPERSGWLQPIVQLFAKNPQLYIAAVSRDAGGLRDAVVRGDDGGADLAAVFSDLGKGEYWFRLEPIRAGAAQPRSIKLDWDPARTGSARLGLAAGLYRIQITNSSGEATGTDAWALVCAPDRYAKAKAAFDNLVNQIAAWRAEIPASGLRALYRAQLDALSG